MKKFLLKFKKKKLNEKLQEIMTFVILVLVIFTVSISTLLTVNSLYQKSKEQANSQLSYMTASYAENLDGVSNLLNTLQMEETIQNYCEEDNRSDFFQKARSDVREILQTYLYIDEDVNFVAALNLKKEYVYSGNYSIVSMRFENLLTEGFENSFLGKERGTLRVYFGELNKQKDFNTITLYQPIYSTVRLSHEIGMICVNIKDNMFENMLNSVEETEMDFSLVDNQGNLISSTDIDMKEGEQVLLLSGEKEGTIQKNGRLYLYKKIPGWNYYLVSQISLLSMYRSSLGMILLIFLVGFILILITQRIVCLVIRENYEPLQSLQDAMDMVALKKLDYRIETSNMGEDFEKLGEGYNMMMHNIQELMEQVREEQSQIDQIRLNALQSQIQPHFLYNTLDCIHWQARAEGNKEISDLVLILAKYYRICLSKGEDVIPLCKELEHIRYYLMIQNKRYGDIVYLDMRVDNDFMDIKIPKLTLQPLVENSIYHGIRIKQGVSGKVTITAQYADNGVLVKVTDTGKGMKAEDVENINQMILDNSENFGYGVRNVNRRIQLLFGEQYGLHYDVNENGGVTVSIYLPKTYEGMDNAIFSRGGVETNVQDLNCG